MSEEKSALRRRITPFIPHSITFADEAGTWVETFQLAYDLNAISLFEEFSGKNLFKDLGVILADPNVTNVTALLWAALQLNHKQYKGYAGLHLLRANLTMEHLQPALDACVQAFLGQLPKEKADKIRQLQAEENSVANAAPLAQGQPEPTSK